MGLWDVFSTRGGIPSHVPAPDRDRELVLYKYDSCPYCRRVYGLIDELRLDVAMRDILQKRESRQELIDATGRSTVPCLFIDGEPLFESSDIMAWLRAYSARDSADVS